MQFVSNSYWVSWAFISYGLKFSSWIFRLMAGGFPQIVQRLFTKNKLIRRIWSKTNGIVLNKTKTTLTTTKSALTISNRPNRLPKPWQFTLLTDLDLGSIWSGYEVWEKVPEMWMHSAWRRSGKRPWAICPGQWTQPYVYWQLNGNVRMLRLRQICKLWIG